MLTKVLGILGCIAVTVFSTDPPQQETCADGEFGKGCFYDCNCVGNKCASNGSCVTGCKEGWSGPTCQRQNIALKGNVTQSPYETKSAKNIIDGNQTTFSETFGSPPYVYVDYGSEVRIDRLKIWYITRPTMKICYTNDVKKFENKSAIYSFRQGCYTSYSSPQTYTYSKKARYIVIFPKQKKSSALLIKEVEAQRNFFSVSKNHMKPAPSNNHPARLATDGNRYSYAETTGNNTAWMTDFGRFCNMSSVTVKFRNVKGSATYEFHISNSSDIYDGKPDNSSRKYSITISGYRTKTWNIKVVPPEQGQFITFIRKGPGLLKLFEITAMETLIPVRAYQTPYEHHYKASRAVDGMDSTFSQTLGIHPYLAIDLGNVTEILSYSIDIALKDQDYQLCVSSNNSALYTQGNTMATTSDTCWNTTHINTTWEIEEHISGRYVSVTSPGEGFLTLKELQIYVCSKGSYGHNCSSQCNNCKYHNCDSLTGNCLEGCSFGVTGRSCSDPCPDNCICNGSTTVCDFCKDGWFGNVCDKRCPTKCFQGCNKTTGTCLNCLPGLYSQDCNKNCSARCESKSGCDRKTGVCVKCKSTFYGNGCEKNCPTSCDTSGCHRESGDCKQCKVGYRGKTCVSLCPSNCNDLGCDIETGFCFGCKLGFAGPKCLTACNTSRDECIECTKDARSCAFDCSDNCSNKNCDKTSGDCISCKKGFYGNVCDKMCSADCDDQGCYQNGTCINCENGSYGTTCSMKCSKTCNDEGCQRVTGDCNDCKVGYFGRYCADKCPDNCGNEGCNTETKFCITCKSGYYGNACKKPCQNQCDSQGCELSSGQCYRCRTGFYGNMCTSKCSDNCNYDGCSMEDGFCYGCKDGYFGSDCSKPCPAGCNPQGCSKDTGICYSCMLGKFGAKCDNNCPSQCIGCSKSSGECVSCKNGFYGPSCKKQCPQNCNNEGCNTLGNCFKCDDGYYGKTCDMLCSEKCAKRTCDMNQGTCVSCNTGYFGDGCNISCPRKCNKDGCIRETGKCFGCVLGYHGNDCSISCPDNCDGRGCGKESGHCFGCKLGFYGVKCNNFCPYDCDSKGCKLLTGECWKKRNNTLMNGLPRSSAQKQMVSQNNEGQLLGPILGIALLNIIITVAVSILMFYCIQRKRYDSNYKRFNNEQVNNPTFNWATTDIVSPDKEATA